MHGHLANARGVRYPVALLRYNFDVYQRSYGVFDSDEFAEHYFRLMEQMKNSQEVNFRMVLGQVRLIQNTYEVSFSSKQLHTLNPRCLIWDSVVTGRHFGIKVPTSRENREEACSKRYEEYEEKFLKFLSSEEGQLIIRLFDGKFPDSGISDVKKIDFILWQDR